MKRFTKQLNFYVNSNLHVALAGYSLTRLTEIYYQLPHSYVPLFVAFSIVVSYNFIRFYEVMDNKINWFQEWFIKNQYKIFFSSFIAFLGILYLVFFNYIQLKTLLLALPFAFITLFYVVPIWKWRGLEFSFRNFPAIKIISISIAWSGSTILLPFINNDIGIEKFVGLAFFQQIIFLVVYTLPFDIRDLHLDNTSLKTIPQMIGVLATKILSTILVLFWLYVSFFYTNTFDIEMLIIALIIVLLTWFTRPNKDRFYTSFWVEGIPIFWLILELIF